MSFQNEVPPSTHRYKYEGYLQCLLVVEEEYRKCPHGIMSGSDNPYFIMDIDERSFLECFVNSGERMLTLSWEIYDYVSQSVLLKMESRPHAVAGQSFNAIFTRWVESMPDVFLVDTHTSNVPGQTRRKRPDVSWTLRQGPDGKAYEWPIFVAEVAYTERRSKLLHDMEFWLNETNSGVRVAITITVLRQGILVEKWVTRGGPPFPSERIELRRHPRLGQPQVNGRLEIPFHDVFLRQKRAGETDFILTAADMRYIADRVWTVQPEGS